MNKNFPVNQLATFYSILMYHSLTVQVKYNKEQGNHIIWESENKLNWKANEQETHSDFG